MFGPGLAVRVFPAGAWLVVVLACGDDTARVAVGDGCRRLGVVAAAEGPNWSREGVARSLGFRRVPPGAVPGPGARDSRDGEVRTELLRGTGSLEAWGSLDGRGRPLGLVGRVSSMLAGGVAVVGGGGV